MVRESCTTSKHSLISMATPPDSYCWTLNSIPLTNTGTPDAAQPLPDATQPRSGIPRRLHTYVPRTVTVGLDIRDVPSGRSWVSREAKTLPLLPLAPFASTLAKSAEGVNS